jgi:hypothetical protein
LLDVPVFSRCARSGQRVPFAGVLGASWSVKFEGQFKHRAESKVNAAPARASGIGRNARFAGVSGNRERSIHRGAWHGDNHAGGFCGMTIGERRAAAAGQPKNDDGRSNGGRSKKRGRR